jgi:putative membrane protein
MRRLAVPAVIAALMIAGCGRQQAAAPPITSVPVSPALATAAYLALAVSTDLFEIRSAELAARRASNPRLREFARRMIADHHGTAAQLSFAGRRLNLLPSATLNPEHQAMLNELAAATDFDRTYLRQQLAVHQTALAIHSSYAARGPSPTMRPVAANAAPIVRRHLQELRAIR